MGCISLGLGRSVYVAIITVCESNGIPEDNAMLVAYTWTWRHRWMKSKWPRAPAIALVCPYAFNSSVHHVYLSPGYPPRGTYPLGVWVRVGSWTPGGLPLSFPNYTNSCNGSAADMSSVLVVDKAHKWRQGQCFDGSCCVDASRGCWDSVE